MMSIFMAISGQMVIHLNCKAIYDDMEKALIPSCECFFVLLTVPSV